MEQNKPVEPCLPIHFQLLAIWERILACRVESVTASFLELGGTPALAQAMLHQVAREIDQTPSAEEFLRQPTIAALADAMLELHDHQDVFEVQRGNGAVPFFFFHGDILGGGFYARTLARQLGPERPVYILPPPRVTKDSTTTIEEIASERCRQIRCVRPRGPYMIGGFCISGLVAYEVARQLVEGGEEVPSVVLVDPELPTRVERMCLRALERAQRRGAEPYAMMERFTTMNQKLARLHDVWQSPLREKLEFVLGNAKKLLRRGNGHSHNASGNESQSPDVTRDGWRLDVFQWLATTYKLKPYPGRVTILITEEQQKARPSLVRTWNRMVSELRVRTLPGRHMTANTTCQAELAARIKMELHAVHSMVTAILSGLAIA
jgi:thioesterase domain-containing protein